jgi:putative ABC transport system permease protein
MLAGMFHDIRFAARLLMRSPAFATVAVVTLALGIGANAAMFGIVNATILQPLPYADAERLVYVRETTPEGHNFSASEPNYLDFRDGAASLESLAAFRDDTPTIVHGGEPQRVYGLAVTHDFFTTLGIAPALGRGFVAAETAPGADTAVVVLGHSLWHQRFSGDPGIVGQEVDLEGRAHLVVGVMPPGFEFAGAQLWTALAPEPGARRDDHWLGMVGKLAPGASAESAHAELSAIATRIGQDHPNVAGWGVRIEPLSQVVVNPQFRLTAYMLFGAVGFLLLLTCANLAGLQIARATRRTAELGIRAALGAARARLVRQMLVESALLAMLGVFAGLALAHIAIGSLQAIGPDAIPRLDEIRMDGTVLAFTAYVGAVAAILSGLLPALRASRPDINEVVKQGGRTGLSRQQRRTGSALVVAQVALAMVLLVGAGLLMRSFLELRASDPGFDPTSVLAVELQLDDRYAEPWQKVVFFRELARSLEGQPGIRAAGATATQPFSGSNFMNDVTPVERAAQIGPGGFMQANWRAVTPGFFEAMGVPLLRGRTFNEGDRHDGPRQIVISETLAARMWPDEDAVGKSVYWGGTSGTPLTVIGVVSDYQDVEVGATAPPVMFLPYNQLPWPKMTLVVRTDADADAVAAVIRERIREMDASLAVPAITTLREEMSAAVAGPRFRTVLLGAFALIALALAAVGIYGAVALNVGQRRREVGLRIALGAQPGTVVRDFVADGARLAVAGLLIGLAGAWALSRLMEGLLYETPPLDLSVFATATIILGAVALIATFAPANRAGRVDPMEALRDE